VKHQVNGANILIEDLQLSKFSFPLINPG